MVIKPMHTPFVSSKDIMFSMCFKCLKIFFFLKLLLINHFYFIAIPIVRILIDYVTDILN